MAVGLSYSARQAVEQAAFCTIPSATAAGAS